MENQEIINELLQLEAAVVESEQVEENNSRPLLVVYENGTHKLEVRYTYINALPSREWMAQEFVTNTLIRKDGE